MVQEFPKHQHDRLALCIDRWSPFLERVESEVVFTAVIRKALLLDFDFPLSLIPASFSFCTHNQFHYQQ